MENPGNGDEEKGGMSAEKNSKQRIPQKGVSDIGRNGSPSSGPNPGAGGSKKPGSSGRKEKLSSSVLVRRKYSLRSSSGGVRVLRSREAPATPKTVSQPGEKSAESKGRGIRKNDAKKKTCGEFDTIRSHCKYFLNRIKCEQNLLDAYASEGWRGQSLEKIRPEKELQRAALEITRCKVKVRDLFKKMDTLCAEGKLDESLFDSEGEIDSEDIFCAKCGSKDLRADDDIILCDGVCDRGFHQMCLEPPLLKDQIPPDDEGWLCPGCDCKVDCIDVVNHALGTHFSVEDNWEKFFPEAAAGTAGDKQYNDLDFPSDDSEDRDYNPDDKGVEEFSQNEESSSSDQSFESTSLSDDSRPSTGDKPLDPAGLPSDDSEDDDFDPLGRDPHENVQKEGSSSDESDFSSDTDDLGGLDEDNESMGPDEAHPTSSLLPSNDLEYDKDKHSIYDEVPSVAEDNSSVQVASTVLRKRNRQILNCKELENESKSSSSSSSDEGQTFKTPKKRINTVSTSKKNAVAIKSRTSKSPQFKSKGKVHLSQVGDYERTPRRTRKKLKLDMGNHAADNSMSVPKEGSSGSKVSSPGSKTFGAPVLKRLHESFKDNIYPTRETKENLSKELDISVYQVSRWFEKARKCTRSSSTTKKCKTEFPAKFSDRNAEQVDGCYVIQLSGGTSKNKDKKNGRNSTEPASRKNKDKVKSGETDMMNADGKGRKGVEVGTPKRLRESFKEGIYPTRETKENLSQELGITVNQVSKWFENARRSMRRLSITKESQTKNNSPNNNPTAAKIDIGLISSKSSAANVEQVKGGDKFQLPKGSSDNQDEKNGRTSTKPASRKKKDKVESGGTEMLIAGGRVMKGMKVDTPKRLCESFKDNMYPTRETKESLSKELGISVRQINRWFENTRRSMRRCQSSTTKESATENNSQNENITASKIDIGLVSAKICIDKEQAKGGDGIQLPGGGSENQDEKNGRNSAVPAPRKNKDKVESGGTDVVDADGKIIKGMEIDTPKVLDNGQNNKLNSSGTRIKTKSRKLRS